MDGVGHDRIRIHVLAESEDILAVLQHGPDRQLERFVRHDLVGHLRGRGVTPVGTGDGLQGWKDDLLPDFVDRGTETHAERDLGEPDRDAGSLVHPGGDKCAALDGNRAVRAESRRHGGRLTIVDDETGLECHFCLSVTKSRVQAEGN